ncbi:uncharacterized protein LOC129317638 isoform X2 [Prosopis cineraria]|uniref:uncharacterized protein LOC129317638 isoform X2 n=1 Tax=Prosopis cineraria TaxID=364024 RepID=UPI00240F4B63|nr:uncharacterized protein LOC129317638 isoform X2 [Prosopis cineraria]
MKTQKNCIDRAKGWPRLTTLLRIVHDTRGDCINMGSFAGKIGFKISSQLQCRAYSIPWAIWKNPVTCLKSRDHSSSAPVRYTPKTSSKVKLSKASPQVKNLEKSNYFSPDDVSAPEINGEKSERGKIARCEASQIQNEMQNNLLFGDMGRGCEPMEEVEEAAEELTIYQAGNSFEQDILQINECTAVVEESAIKLLATRALTTVELKKKLLGKRFSSDAVEAVINKFVSKGLINDKLYAESFSRSRWSSSSWGPRRIKQALSKKGVSQADAEKAVELVFREDIDGDPESTLGLSKHSIDHLYVQASKQWIRSHDVPKETRKSRVVRWLQYRGFDWDVINFVLKKLERQAPP